MSNLSELLPAGAGAKSASFVASGTLGSGRTVSLNDDGTISASEVTYSQTALNGKDTIVSGVNEKVDICYDSGSDRLVLLYRVASGSIGGYARVLSLSGTTFSAGSAVQYNSGYTREGDICYDSVNDKVLVTYRDDGDGGGDGTFRVGTVSDLSITFGTEGRFETDSMYSTEAEYHPTLEKIGLLYTLGESAGGSLQIRIAEISGTTATFGSRVQITSDVEGAGHYIQPIDDDKFVVFYNDNNNSTYLYAVTVTVSGLVATLGTPTVIASLNQRITGLSVAGDKILATTWEGYYYYVQLSGANSYTTLASGQTNINYRNYATVYEPVTNLFLAVYQDASDSNYTYSQNISVSGNTLTFSSSVLVSNTDTGYPDNDWGYAVTLDTSQNTMVANWHAASSNISTVSAYRPEYEETNVPNFIGITDEAIADTATGAVIVQGGVSDKAKGPAESSFGSASVFESATSNYISAVYDSSSNKIVIAYEDSGNSSYGTAVVGTVSGTGISFGTPVVFESAITQWPFATFDSTNNKVVIAYRDYNNSNRGTAIVGTVSGTSISFGSAAVFENAAIGNTLSATYDSTNQKVVIAYRDTGNSNYGTAIVGTVSGTSISFGTAVVFASSFSFHLSATYDSTNQKVVIAYRDLGNSNYGTAVVGTVSGTSISFGTPVVFETATSDYNSATYDSTNQKVVIAYQDSGNSGYGTAIVGTVSGTSISFGTAVVFETASSTFISTTYDSTNQKIVTAYKDGGNSNYGTGIVSSIAFPLTPNTDYYVQDDGSLSTTVSSAPAGRALSSTSILLEG